MRHGIHRFLPSAAVAGACVAALWSAAPDQAAASVLLYDVDFGPPTHSVGAAPATGFGAPVRDTPTLVNVFNPANSAATVVAAFASLSNQPLEVRAVETSPGVLGGLNVHFTLDDPLLPSGPGVYHLSADVIINHIDSNQVAFFWDAPNVHRVSFRPDGSIGMLGPGGAGTIGAWSMDELVHVDSSFSTVTGEWSVALNGGPAFSGITPNLGLQELRFGSTTVPSSRSYLDNVRITFSTVPEPGVLGLLATGLALAGLRTRRRVRLVGDSPA